MPSREEPRRGLARSFEVRVSAGKGALIERLSGVCCTLRRVSFLLHRLGFSPQVPAHRAFERDEDAVAEWRSATWAKVRGRRR
jgi:hypothetical protein